MAKNKLVPQNSPLTLQLVHFKTKKPIAAPLKITAFYLGGGVQVASGDIYTKVTRTGKNTFTHYCI